MIGGSNANIDNQVGNILNKYITVEYGNHFTDPGGVTDSHRSTINPVDTSIIGQYSMMSQ